MKHSSLALLAAAAAACAVSACSSNGDAAGSTPVSPPPPPAAVSPPPPPASSFETVEYNRDYSKALINASTAYSAGATGEGVTIAVIDTGIDVDHDEFADGRVSAASVDIYSAPYAGPGYLFTPSTTRDHLDDEDGHGTGVSSLAAGAKLPDGDPLLAGPTAGIHGVAFGATILAVRSDTPSDDCPPDCSFSSEAVAAAIDYAVEHGADIINLSLGGDPLPTHDISSAMRRAVLAGVIIVSSAGNSGSDVPDSPSNFAGDPTAHGLAIAVGSVGADSTISDFSNKAGGDDTIADYFVVAPGQDLVAATLGDFCGAGSTSCYLVDGSGTSFASPMVAGALALLLDAFPGLTPADAVEILLTTAEDLGDPGVDEVYGRGLIDLAAAFAPLGAATVDFSEGGAIVTLEALIAPPSGATGDWITASGLVEGAVVRDSYHRAFSISPDLAPSTSSALGAFESASLSQRLAARGAFTAFGSAAFRAPDDVYIANPNLVSDDDLTPELSVTVRQGPLSFAMGRGFAAPAPLNDHSMAALTPSATSGAVAALTSTGDWASIGYDVGGWTVGFRSAGDEGRAFSAATLSRRFGAHVAGIETGTAREDDVALGGAVASRLGGEDGAETSFTALAWSGPVADGWRGSARVEAAQSEFNLPGFVEVTERPLASAWTLGLERAIAEDRARLGFTLAQPLRAEAGSVAVMTPVGVTATNATIRELRSAALTPSGREIDFETTLRFGLGLGAEGQVAARIADEPAHVADADPEAAMWLGMRWTR